MFVVGEVTGRFLLAVAIDQRPAKILLQISVELVEQRDHLPTARRMPVHQPHVQPVEFTDGFHLRETERRFVGQISEGADDLRVIGLNG